MTDHHKQIILSNDGAEIVEFNGEKAPAQSNPTEIEPTKRRGPGRPRLTEPSPEFVARREEIVAAAAEVFREKGFDAGTLDDVADALDLRRASLYYYVHSKANLLNLVFEQALDVALAQLDELFGVEDPGERLEALIRHQVTTVASQPSLFSVFFDSRPRLDPRYEDAMARRERKYLAVYRAAVEDAVATGIIGDVHPRYATQAILGMANWHYKWIEAGQDNIEDLADTCVEIILGR